MSNTRGTWAEHLAAARGAGWRWGLCVGGLLGFGCGGLLAVLVLR